MDFGNFKVLDYLPLDTTTTIFIGTAFVGICAGLFVSRFNLIYLASHKADAESKRNGGELVADVLKAHNVKFIFTLCGGHISPILVAAEKHSIRVIDTRHEVSAVFAADAVARLSGTVGVVAVTAGPGLTNTITAVKNAQMAESPILLLGGAAASILKGRGALQDIDQMSLFQPLCKFVATVKTVRDIVPTLRRAIQLAQEGTPGPVFVELPIDVLYPYNLIRREMGIKDSAKGVLKIINWYLNNYLENLFAGAWEPRPTDPLPVNIPKASYSHIQRCAELLTRARKPVILLGSQATLPPTPVDEVRQSLESMGVPCFLGGMSRGLLGKNSEIQMRQKRRDALSEADVVILAGCVCDFRLSYGRVLSKKSKIIAVNRDSEQLYKNSRLYWSPTLAVLADVGSFIRDLAAAVKGYKCDPEWLLTLRERDSAKETANEKMSLEMTETHLNPLKVLSVLEEVLPDNTILVADGGDFVGTAAYILRPRGPLMWLDPGAFGTLGVGGGFALGAKLCRPDCEVWIVWGDGSCGYSIAEFDTYTRHRTPIMAIVGNDAGWTQIAREQVPMLGSSVGCQLAHTDYHVVAEGYGGKGVLMGRGENDKITEVLRQAQAMCREGHSVLVNVLIGTTKFREGSISV